MVKRRIIPRAFAVWLAWYELRRIQPSLDPRLLKKVQSKWHRWLKSAVLNGKVPTQDPRTGVHALAIMEACKKRFGKKRAAKLECPYKPWLPPGIYTCSSRLPVMPTLEPAADPVAALDDVRHVEPGTAFVIAGHDEQPQLGKLWYRIEEPAGWVNPVYVKDPVSWPSPPDGQLAEAVKWLHSGKLDSAADML
ncbi:MAG: hypothetical protein V3T83_09665 [Acidobacteriota bacterium]